MTSPAENPTAARVASPLAAKDPQIRARRLLVITAQPGDTPFEPTVRKRATSPQLREAVSAAMKAARRVRRTVPPQ